MSLHRSGAELQRVIRSVLFSSSVSTELASQLYDVQKCDQVVQERGKSEQRRQHTEQSAGLYKVGGSRARAAPGEHRAGGPRCYSATVLHCFGAGLLWPLDPETAARDSFPRSGFCRIVLLCPHRATKDHNHTSTQDAGSIWKLNCYYNAFLIQDT